MSFPSHFTTENILERWTTPEASPKSGKETQLLFGELIGNGTGKMSTGLKQELLNQESDKTQDTFKRDCLSP